VLVRGKLPPFHQLKLIDRCVRANAFVAEPAVVFQKTTQKRAYSPDPDRPFKIVVQTKPEFVLISTSWDVVRHAERLTKKKRKVAVARERRKANEADEAAKVVCFKDERDKAVAEFELRFDWEDRKVMLAAGYWTEKHDLSVSQGRTKGTTMAGLAVGASSARVSRATAEQWMTDWHNNEGFFSASLWGANTKTASILGDVDTRQWVRAWVIQHMGHKSGKKNLTNIDFNKAVHEEFSLPYDAKKRVISLEQTRLMLIKAGARYLPVKQGNVHHDNHGADHVVKYQRPAFLDLHRQLYNRGPNFVQVGSTFDGKYVDKDLIPDLEASGLLESPYCRGPRGTHMGGMPNPEFQTSDHILPFARAVDSVGKVWHTGCHDECCVHCLKEEGFAWFIPGVDMGDMPTKSDGDILHMSEMDMELAPGCLSLDGEVGAIQRKEMHDYIQGKHRGENPKVPLYSSVHMHAGKGHEGSWMGDDAHMHMELLLDQFDVLMNLQHRIADPTTARADELLAITASERSSFKHGLACQVDRSQGHMKRAVDGLNTKNGKGINAKPGGLQPHFRHTFAPLPDGFSDWKECRQRLCVPGCVICEAAAVKYGHRHDFQSTGRKGSLMVLTERGITEKMNAKKQAERLNEEPDWGQTQSAMQELFQSRGHFLLVGAACHAELAYKEHGWARLKQKVRPFVDGTMTTIRMLVLAAMKELLQRCRLQDARRCREVMKAYRTLAENGESANAEVLKLWEKAHRRHRGVHCSETAALLLRTGMAAPEPDARTVKKLKTQSENEAWHRDVEARNLKRWKYLKRRAANLKQRYDADAQANARNRKIKFKQSHPEHKNKRLKRFN
jgi:hypothetical protein